MGHEINHSFVSSVGEGIISQLRTGYVGAMGLSAVGIVVFIIQTTILMNICISVISKTLIYVNVEQRKLSVTT